MVVEALTFKLSLDFFVYLKKYKIDVTKIRLGFFDIAINKTEYTDFNSISEMEVFYQSNYVPFDPCYVGDLVSIQLFLGASTLYDFTTEYRVSDLTGLLKITPGSSFDIQRNKQRAVLTDRQTAFMNRAVADYRKFWNEIHRIYTTEVFTERNNIAEFPYDDANIIPEPPE